MYMNTYAYMCTRMCTYIYIYIHYTLFTCGYAHMTRTYVKTHICNLVCRCLVVVDLPILLLSSKIRISESKEPMKKDIFFILHPWEWTNVPKSRDLCKRKCHFPSSIFNLSFRGSSKTSIPWKQKHFIQPHSCISIALHQTNTAMECSPFQ